MNQENRKSIHSTDTYADGEPSTSSMEEFSTLQITTINQSKDERDEVYASVELITHSKTIAVLRAKDDTGAQGNTMPVLIVNQLYPCFD